MGSLVNDEYSCNDGHGHVPVNNDLMFVIQAAAGRHSHEPVMFAHTITKCARALSIAPSLLLANVPSALASRQTQKRLPVYCR